MTETITLVLWIAGAGVHLGEAKNWDDCGEAMKALDKLNIETTCHLFEKPIRPKRRPQ